MDWIVTTARTVEEAQTRALDLLGVDSADAEIQVIEEGKTGLFGRTKSEARVRARIKPKAPATKDERRPSRGDRNRSRNKGGGGGGGGRGGNRRNEGSSKGDGGRGGNRSGSNKGDGGGRKRSKDTADSGSDKKSRSGSGNEGSSKGDGGRGGNRSGSNKGDGGGRNRNRGGKGDRNSGGNNRNNEDRVEMPIEEQRETLQEFVSGVAAAFDPGATVELVEEGTTLQAQVTGEDLGRLVGAKAATLQALEELSRTAMHRAAAGRRYHRIQVDVDNYRGRRREALVKFATDLARQVAETGESKAMEPMGAADRKLIHDAVAEVDGVETVSEGRDPRRYIVLLATDGNDEEE